MKPLPFDMTPLAHSLSLAPASRVDLITADRDQLDDVLAHVEPALPARELADDPIDVTEILPVEEILEQIPEDPIPEEQISEEQIIDEPIPEVVQPPKRPTRKERRSRRKRKQQDSELVEAPQPAPASTPATADSQASLPATELRTATYPRHLRAHGGWASQLAQEQIHALATHILARHTQGNLRTLAVTSALAGEGKTTVTLALGEKLAVSGKRVIVLDLDTHRATLSREAGLGDAAGALQSSDPRDPANMEFHAYATDVPGVSIMPVGYPPAGLDGPPLLSPVHIGILVLNAIENFDMVLLDCPPLLPVADTHVLREVVDAALMVVKAGSTPRDMIDQAIDDFGREKFLGAVLNCAKPKDIPYFREVYGYYRRDTDRG